MDESAPVMIRECGPDEAEAVLVVRVALPNGGAPPNATGGSGGCAGPTAGGSISTHPCGRRRWCPWASRT